MDVILNAINFDIDCEIYGSTDKTNTACFFFGYLGIASALVFTNLGTAYGTSKIL